MLGIIAMTLLALIAAGLLAVLFVKLTTTVGQYLLNLINRIKKRIALTKMKEILEEINKNGKKNEVEKANKELSAEDLILWATDENGVVDKESIQLINEEYVDKKTKQILDMHDGMVEIAPIAI